MRVKVRFCCDLTCQNEINLKMYRFSLRSLVALTNFIAKNRQVVLKTNNCTSLLIKVPCNVAFYQHFSDESKIQSPLSNLMTKDSPEKPNKEEEETKKQQEASWRAMKFSLIFFGVTFSCLGTYLLIVLGAPERDKDGKIIEDDLSDLSMWKQYILRTYRELDNYRRLIKEPSRDKLLPDPLAYPYLQPKYTLVLELTDVLVHPDWTYNTGWRFKKRPGLDFFLESLHGSYEIVVYTAEQGMTVFPLMEALDPKNLISYKLVRDATHFTGGHHVKSLDKLNRDLSKVIVVDWNANNVQFHPHNLFKIKRWDGTDDDLTLVDLTNFLKAIVENDIEDVRVVMKYYGEYDDPIEAFREKQKNLMDMLEAQNAAKKEHEAAKPKSWMPSWFMKKTPLS